MGTCNYERSLMEEITAQHFKDLETPLVKPGLKDAAPPSARVLAELEVEFGETLSDANVLVALVSSVHSRIVHGGDVVVYRKSSTRLAVAEAWYHMSVRGTCY